MIDISFKRFLSFTLAICIQLTTFNGMTFPVSSADETSEVTLTLKQ